MVSVFQPFCFAVATRPFIAPIYALCGLAFMLMLASSLGALIREAIKHTSRMHQIPCANCQFFTNDYSLKCTIHPSEALSEAAINCPDYQALDKPYSTLN
jgi:hypothetical protein